MGGLHKSLVTDEHNRPVAVQIDYVDWVTLETRLGEGEMQGSKVVSLDAYAGTVPLDTDPLEYQNRMREEWH